jgi:glycosyltransferase involved in cell wall biosynthesis
MADFTTFANLLKSVGIQESPVTPAATKEPKRFLLVGTHAQQTTGYSKVTYNIVKEISKCSDIQLFHFGFQRFHEIGQNYRPYPENVDVYDPHKAETENADLPKEHGFGFSQLPDYIRKVKPDVMLIYNDASIICSFLEKLQNLKPEEKTYKLVIYLDQVYNIQKPEFLARIDRDADVYFAFTNYWRDVMKRQGIQKPIYVLRHGFDADTYRPMDRLEMRKKHGIPANLFLLLNVNRNTPRKRWDLVVTAFAELVARYPQKPIAFLCVTDTGVLGGYPIHEIYTRELIRRNVNVEHHIDKLMITKTSLNYTDETINELYAMSDVGVTATEGEGFGLCHFEAMGCGIPQVVPDIGGFKDFCTTDNSVLVKAKQRYYLPNSYSPIGGEIELVDPADLCLGIEEYLLDSEKREEHGKKARETVLKYRWEDEVAELVRVIKDL